MEKFTSYEFFSAALVCFFAALARLGAEVNKYRETKNLKYRITGWKVLYNLSATFLAGFLTITWLWESSLGNGKKILIVFLSSFLAPVGIDALMLVSGKMVLHEFAKWLSTKTGSTSPADLPEESSPVNEATNETDDSMPAQ